MSHDVRYSKGMTTSRETIIETATALNCSLTLNAPRNLHIQLASDDDTQTCVLRVTFDRIGRITEAEIDDLAAHAGYRIIRGGLGRVIGEMQLAAEKRDAAPAGACVEPAAVHGHDGTCTRVVELPCDDEPLPNVRPGGDVFDELDEQYLAADGFDTRGRTAARAIPAEQPERRDEIMAYIGDDETPVRPYHVTDEMIISATSGSGKSTGITDAMLDRGAAVLLLKRTTLPSRTAVTGTCGDACCGWCVLDGRPCTADDPEFRETVWCMRAEPEHRGPHFETESCVEPHLTDGVTRDRLNLRERRRVENENRRRDVLDQVEVYRIGPADAPQFEIGVYSVQDDEIVHGMMLRSRTQAERLYRALGDLLDPSSR